MANKKLTEEQIRLLADHLMPAFIPKNESEQVFTFHFTTSGTSYKVSYLKRDKHWMLEKFEEIVENY